MAQRGRPRKYPSCPTCGYKAQSTQALAGHERAMKHGGWAPNVVQQANGATEPEPVRQSDFLTDDLVEQQIRKGLSLISARRQELDTELSRLKELEAEAAQLDRQRQVLEGVLDGLENARRVQTEIDIRQAKTV